MKKRYAILLGLLMCFCVFLLPTEARAETEGYFTYRISGGTAIVIEVDHSFKGDLIIPETLGGYPVKAVAGEIFEHHSDITSITLPASVETFDYYRGNALIWVDEANPHFTSDDFGVLYSKDMQTLHAAPRSLSGVYAVAEGTQKIGFQAFFLCENLTQVILPEGLVELEISAFTQCTKLESVNIPSSVRKLGAAAFNECRSLKSISIPDGVTVVPASFCWDCEALETVELPESVTSIGQGAFYECAKLKNIDLSYVTKIYDEAFFFCQSLTGKIVLAEGLTELQSGAFAWCTGLEEVVLPESLQKIGESAFSGCNNLKELRIPAGVTEIGDYQVVLDGFYVAEGNPNYFSDDRGVLYTKDLTRLINAPRNLTGAYTVAEETVEIAPNGFYYCENMKSVVLPEGLTTIYENAFSYCTGLTDIELPKSLMTMENRAFAYCTGLTELPDFKNVTVLPYECFRGCTGLISVAISEGIIELEPYVFRECAALTEIAFPASLKKIDYGVFYKCPTLQKVDSCSQEDTLEIWEWSSTTDTNKDLVNAQWTYHRHTSPEIVRESTCTVRGQRKVWCETCGESKVTYMSLLEHIYSQQYAMDADKHWNKCITCDKYDKKYYHEFVDSKCSVCGYVEGDSITTQPTTRPTIPTTVPTIPKVEPTIPTPGSTVPTQTIQPTQQGGQEQQPGDPIVVILIIAGVLVLAGGITTVILLKKRK